MQNYWMNIQGWFNFQDIYQEVVAKYGDGSTFIEVGVWKGKSAAFMAETIKESNKKIRFDCVDTWEGSEEHVKDIDIINGTLFETFLNNMKPLEGFYNPVRLPSIEAAKLYEDKSLQFVFIDAAHDYENVIKDIKTWLPKIAEGGIIAGHDIDWPDVRKAVQEVFPSFERRHGSWLQRL